MTETKNLASVEQRLARLEEHYAELLAIIHRVVGAQESLMEIKHQEFAARLRAKR